MLYCCYGKNYSLNRGINVNSDITFITGGKDILDDIEELWEELNLHHLERSHDFKQHYMAFTFRSRKESFVAHAENGKLLIVIAYHKDLKIGYCVSSIVDGVGVGEISSIYIKPDYRKSRIGDMFMKTSLDWIQSYNVKKIIVKVAVGNEEIFGFYSTYGFAPRFTELQLICE